MLDRYARQCDGDERAFVVDQLQHVLATLLQLKDQQLNRNRLAYLNRVCPNGEFSAEAAHGTAWPDGTSNATMVELLEDTIEAAKTLLTPREHELAMFESASKTLRARVTIEAGLIGLDVNALADKIAHINIDSGREVANLLGIKVNSIKLEELFRHIDAEAPLPSGWPACPEFEADWYDPHNPPDVIKERYPNYKTPLAEENSEDYIFWMWIWKIFAPDSRDRDPEWRYLALEKYDYDPRNAFYSLISDETCDLNMQYYRESTRRMYWYFVLLRKEHVRHLFRLVDWDVIDIRDVFSHIADYDDGTYRHLGRLPLEGIKKPVELVPSPWSRWNAELYQDLVDCLPWPLRCSPPEIRAQFAHVTVPDPTILEKPCPMDFGETASPAGGESE